MLIQTIQNNQWKEVKEIYLESFPKAEQKPFFVIKQSVKRQKTEIITAVEGKNVRGFLMAIPYKDMVMVDYLAVNKKYRSSGTGGQLLQYICKKYRGKSIHLLIENLDETSDNQEQRIVRRKFYLKNGFHSSDFFIRGTSGILEVLNYGKDISENSFMSLQKYALGNLFFRLSKMEFVK